MRKERKRVVAAAAAVYRDEEDKEDPPETVDTTTSPTDDDAVGKSGSDFKDDIRFADNAAIAVLRALPQSADRLNFRSVSAVMTMKLVGQQNYRTWYKMFCNSMELHGMGPVVDPGLDVLITNAVTSDADKEEQLACATSLAKWPDLALGQLLLAYIGAEHHEIVVSAPTAMSALRQIQSLFGKVATVTLAALDRQFREMRCTEQGNVTKHVTDLCALAARVNSQHGHEAINNWSLVHTLLGSLPPSWDVWIDGYTSTIDTAKVPPNEVAQRIMAQAAGKASRPSAIPAGIPDNSSVSAVSGRGKPKKGFSKKKNPAELKCFRCDAMGHSATYCPAPAPKRSFDEAKQHQHAPSAPAPAPGHQPQQQKGGGAKGVRAICAISASFDPRIYLDSASSEN